MRIRAMSAAGLLVGAFLTVGAGTAHAYNEENGVCEDGEVCFYWGDNHTGSMWDGGPFKWDIGAARFITGGSGRGQWVKNNAASVWNNRHCWLRVHYNEGYGDPTENVPPYSKRNLTVLKNNAASYSATC